MNMPIAVSLAVLIVGGLIADSFFYDSTNTLFLLKKLADLIEWLAFWR